jgi:signal transduction histidine kinase
MIFFRRFPHLSLLIFVVLIVRLLLLPHSAKAQLVHVSQNQLEYSLAPACSYFIQKTPGLSFEQVRDSSFTELKKDLLNFGNTPYPIWLKFNLSNSTLTPLALDLGKPHLSKACLFEPVGNSYKTHLAGTHYPSEVKDYSHNRLWFRIPPFTGIKTFYIRIDSPNKTMPISIASEKYAFEEKGHNDMFFGISFGILFMVLISTVFLYVSGGGKVYLYYIGYILFVNLTSAFLVGYTPIFMTNEVFNLGRHVHLIMAVSAIFLTLFSASFLEIKTYMPRFFWPVYVFLAIEVITILSDLLNWDYFGSILIQLFTTGSALYLLPVSIAIYRKGLKNIRFYIMAWALGWLCIVSYLLTINGIFPVNFFTINGVLLGSIFESVLFSVALADKIQSIKKQTENANKQMLVMLQENEKQITKQKEELTAQVLERTKELADKNVELEKYSKGLEALVVERAREIIKMNDELKLQNQRLEQYTFVAAHNIRGPVARIQGLLYLLRIEDASNEVQRNEIVSRLEKSTNELDSIVKDLSFLLAIDRDMQSGKTNVVLPDLLNSVLHALESPIDVWQVFDLQFEATEINSFRPLLYSILYNLVSNSYKFKSEQRPLKIKLKTWEDKRYFFFHIQDNGIGMDVSKFKRKLFSPYQRFHPDIEGKGIGLFLVKTQVDALGGSMELHSETDKGTEITITLIK